MTLFQTLLKEIKDSIKIALMISLVVFIGVLHYNYVKTLFENDRNFSYLSDLEREMSLRTEMGFYYSYYKTVVEETPFIAGMTKLMYDRTVEYPKEVNAFKRFNIHPEVIVGALYRYLEPWINTTAYVECHMVGRGEGYAPVESCVGVGYPIFFYLEAIWVLAGVNVVALFLHGMELSESIFGGLLAVVQYYANHAECTRVQWAPNERENWASPFLLLQAWLLTLQLKENKRRNTIQLQIAMSIVIGVCLLFWQFSQFIFLTQIMIYFLMEQFKIISTFHLSIFLHSHYCGLHVAILFLYGNDMLKSSLYASSFVIVSIYCLFFSGLRVKVQNRMDLFVEAWLVLLRVCIVACSSFYLKRFISDFLELQEDGHVWDILYSKFTDYKSFHTLIYTCSDVFDFLPFSSIRNMADSFLIPYAVFGVLSALFYWVVREKVPEELDGERNAEEDGGVQNGGDKVRKDLDFMGDGIKDKLEKQERDVVVEFLRGMKIEAAIFYNIAQMIVYGVMAALVMRLKLLFTTQLCVLSSLVFKRKYYVYPKKVNKCLIFMLSVWVIPMVWNLVLNINKEVSHMSEFSDYSQEELLEWITKQPIGAYAGSMPILASVMLSTRRPIVVHPHYEHLEARQRVYAVYKVYGRFSSQELYHELNSLRVSYLIVERKYCYGRSNKGCSFADIWDAEAPRNSGRPLLCHTLLTESVEHFYGVFRNQHYAVFRLNDFSVSYMPRSFDT